MSFGFVVDDRGPDKVGGAVAWAARLADHPVDEAAHAASCPSCQLLDRPLGCVGMVPAPLSAASEEWLVRRLPEDLESVGGFLLRKAIGDFGYDGARAKALRDKGRLLAKGPFERHYGPFFRRFVVSSEQILEELLCAGDIAPAHGLAILMHLQALELDGKRPEILDIEGPKLGQIVSEPATRRARTKLALDVNDPEPSDPSLAGLKSLLGALYAGFVLDVDVYVLNEDDQADPAA
jgi:hypothetical protein